MMAAKMHRYRIIFGNPLPPEMRFRCIILGYAFAKKTPTDGRPPAKDTPGDDTPLPSLPANDASFIRSDAKNCIFGRNGWERCISRSIFCRGASYLYGHLLWLRCSQGNAYNGTHILKRIIKKVEAFPKIMQ